MRRFLYTNYLMKMAFKKVRDLIPLVNININATNEHMAEVERRI